MIHANCARAFVIIKWTRFIHWDSITFVVAMFCALCVRNDRQRTNGEKSHPSATIALVRDFVYMVSHCVVCYVSQVNQSEMYARVCVNRGVWGRWMCCRAHYCVIEREHNFISCSFILILQCLSGLHLATLNTARNPPFNPIPFHRRFCSKSALSL